MEQGGNVEENDGKFIWQDKYVVLLIQTRLQFDDEFENPKMRKSKIWQKLSDVIRQQLGEPLEGLNGTLCDSKWRNLLQTYKKVAFKKSAGIPSSWPYYDLIHDGFGQKVVVKSNLWFEKDEDDSNWFEQSRDDEKWVSKKGKETDKTINDPLVNLKRKSTDLQAVKSDEEVDDEDSDDEKPIIHNLMNKKKRKKMSTLELLRKEIAEKRQEDKLYQEEKRQRWEEKKLIEKERTLALLQLTEALNKYTSKKIELVVSQRR